MPPRPGAPVCKFWVRGNCNKGNDCDFQHPGNQAQSQNSFAALGTQGNRGRSGAFNGDKPDPYNVTVNNIKQDLSERPGDDPPGDRPLWPFSAYAPGRDAPRQLLEGDIEQSPEEMRVRFYLAQVNGRPQEYIQQEEALMNQVKQQIQAILNDPAAARQYILDGANVHPNRIEQCQGSSQTFPSSTANPPSTQPAGGFGQPSNFGAASSGNSAFGKASGLGASVPGFGAPSPIGQSSAFGAPSALGGGGGFGRPSALGAGGSAFGQASSLGQSNPFSGAQKPSTFGQASQPGTSGGFANPSGPAFGQSGFGAVATKPAFGAPSQPGTFGQAPQAVQSGFGQASQLGQAAFGQPSRPGQSAFGQPSQPSAFASQQKTSQSGGSGFGAPSAFGAAANKPSPFAAAAQNQQQAPSNPFAAAANKPSPFAAAAAAAASQNQPQTSSPFARPGGAFGSGSNSSSAFGAPSTSNPSFGAPSKTNAFTSSTSATQGQTTLPAHWQNRPIVRDEAGNPCTAVPAPTPSDPQHLDYTRIWFPTGPASTDVPNPDALRDPEGLPEVYAGDMGTVLQQLYEVAMKEGRFPGGVMPETPPRREWVDWGL